MAFDAKMNDITNDINEILEPYKKHYMTIAEAFHNTIKEILLDEWYTYTTGDLTEITCRFRVDTSDSNRFKFFKTDEEVRAEFTKELNRRFDNKKKIIALESVGNTNLILNKTEDFYIEVTICVHYREDVTLTWEDIEQRVDDYARNCIPYGNHDNMLILGINRGGLAPAVMLSHHTGINMKVVDYQTRDGVCNKNDVMEYIKSLLIASDYRIGRIILVDDVLETGKTFNAIEACIDKACDVVEMRNKPDVDRFYLEDTSKLDKWVVFPWEMMASVNNINNN